MDINLEIRKATLPQLISWWFGDDVPDWSSGTTLFAEKVASALRRKGPEGIQFLKSQIDSTDLKRRHLVLIALADKETYDDDIVKFLIDAFRISASQDKKINDAFKELSMDLLVDIGEYPFERAEIEALLEHEDKGLSAAAMVYLSHAFPVETVEILRAGLRSANPTKRGKACTQAGFRNIQELKYEVRELENDSDDYVARSAQIACEVFDIVHGAT